MINVVIPVDNINDDYSKLISQLMDYEGVAVLMGATRSCCKKLKEIVPQDNENIVLIEFNDGSSQEEIMNSLQRYISKGHILILRRPITIKEFNLLIRQNSNVVVAEKKRGKIKNFFFKIWQRILKTVLGVVMYDGDTSVIMFNETISPVIIQTPNMSYSSRVDRWKGLSQVAVPVSGIEKKVAPDEKVNLKYSLFSLLSVCIALAVTLSVLLTTKTGVIGCLLLICLDSICLAITLIILIVIIFNNLIGKKNVGNAVEYISEGEENEEN